MTVEKDLATELNRQCARIAWRELQTFFASGKVVLVGAGHDLISIATEFAQDNATEISRLMDNGHVQKMPDSVAGQLYKDDAQMWGVVVNPWVLVQVIVSDA